MTDPTLVGPSLEALVRNDVFTGGILLVLVGLLGASLHTAVQLALARIRREFVVSLEVRSEDEAFEWLMKWLAAHTTSAGPDDAKTAGRGLTAGRELSLYTTRENATDRWMGNTAKLASRPTLHFAPAPGLHFYHFRGQWITVHRGVRESHAVPGVRDMNMSQVHETLKLSAFGRNPRVLQDLAREAMHLALGDELGKTLVFQPTLGYWLNGACQWRKAMTLDKRALESVHLPRGMMEQLVGDVREFLRRREWYHRRGIPHRRGLLLFGPPGCGKSSFAAALAGELGLNLCVCSLAANKLNDEDLQEFLRGMPKGSVLLLEDVDAAFTRRDRTEPPEMPGVNRVTFSGLLNALDGVVAYEGSIVLMTTNHREKLDPALTRPGRVDVSVYVGLAQRDQISRLFAYFYRPWEKAADLESRIEEGTIGQAEADAYRARLQREQERIEKQAKKFSALIPEEHVSMASVQGYLLRHKTNPQAAIDNAKTFLRENHEEESKHVCDGGSE